MCLLCLWLDGNRLFGDQKHGKHVAQIIFQYIHLTPLLMLSATLLCCPRFGIPGGIDYPLFGTLAEYLVLSRDLVVPVPEHMTDEEAGTWGLGAVTAWR